MVYLQPLIETMLLSNIFGVYQTHGAQLQDLITGHYFENKRHKIPKLKLKREN